MMTILPRRGGARLVEPRGLASGIQLAQGDFAVERADDDVCVLDAFVDHFLLGGFVSEVLHAQVVDFVGEAVERGHVLIDEGVAEVPIGVGGGLVEEELVAGDESGGLLRLEEGNDIGLDVGEEGVGVAGNDVEERDAFDGALAVGDLSVGRGERHDGDKQRCYCDAESWFHLATFHCFFNLIWKLAGVYSGDGWL